MTIATASNPWGRAPRLRKDGTAGQKISSARYPSRALAPFAPDAWRLFRFWIAGPLTLLLFTPALLAGVFGAPAMLPGLYFAYRMLRSGRDGYADFVFGGFLIGTMALLIALPFGGGLLYCFGLFFGPLMAMCFRWIAGDWRREVRGKPVTGLAVSLTPAMPPLAPVPRTQ